MCLFCNILLIPHQKCRFLLIKLSYKIHLIRFEFSFSQTFLKHCIFSEILIESTCKSMRFEINALHSLWIKCVFFSNLPWNQWMTAIQTEITIKKSAIKNLWCVKYRWNQCELKKRKKDEPKEPNRLLCKKNGKNVAKLLKRNFKNALSMNCISQWLMSVCECRVCASVYF